MIRVVGSTLMVALLSGCAVTSNVRGNFACGAPEGTCAPTINIDDGAIAKALGVSPAALASPATEAADQEVFRNGGAEGLGRRARIVFPAFTDAKGRLHETSAIYVTLNDNVVVTSGAEPAVPVAEEASAPKRYNLVTAAAKGEIPDIDLMSIVPTDQVRAPRPIDTVLSSNPQLRPKGVVQSSANDGVPLDSVRVSGATDTGGAVAGVPVVNGPATFPSAAAGK